MSRSPIKITPSSSVAEEVELESNCTRDDFILKSAIIHTLTGWPKYEKDIPDNLRELFNVRSLLSVSNGFRTNADMIVIPTALGPDLLDKIDAGHQGITKCLERARVSARWPGITRDIMHVFGACDRCQVHRPSQHREPLMSTSLPWQREVVDLCSSQGKDYKVVVVVIDYHSRWIDILHPRNTISAAYIAKLNDIFARFDIPIELVTDDAAQFSSSDFKSFAEQNGLHL